MHEQILFYIARVNWQNTYKEHKLHNCNLCMYTYEQYDNIFIIFNVIIVKKIETSIYQWGLDQNIIYTSKEIP